jgi:Fe2+ transport system protein FeoA
MNPCSAVNQSAPRALSELQVGQSGIVSRLDIRGRSRRRLLEMGLVTGERVRIERVAPLGDPVALRIKGYQLALRRADAGQIWVTDVE